MLLQCPFGFRSNIFPRLLKHFPHFPRSVKPLPSYLNFGTCYVLTSVRSSHQGQFSLLKTITFYPFTIDSLSFFFSLFFPKFLSFSCSFLLHLHQHGTMMLTVYVILLRLCPPIINPGRNSGSLRTDSL